MKIEKFEEYLRKTRKSNGEFRLDKTIQQYMYYISSYFDTLESILDDVELTQYMNRNINSRQSQILHAVFSIYLEFRGYDVIEDKIIFSRLRKPNKKATAFSSKRTMQSKLLTNEEYKLLVSEADTIQFKCAIAMSFDLGCRISELTNIHYRDITFSVSAEDKKAGIRAHVKLFGKGGKYRLGYIHEKTYTLLFEMCGGKFNKEDKVFVFLDSNGEPYQHQEKAFRDKLRQLAKKVLRRHVTPHMARHSRATLLAEKGFPANAIQNILGHEDIRTSSVYVKNTNRTGHEAMKERGGDFL